MDKGHASDQQQDKHYKIILGFYFLWQKYAFLSAFAQHTAGACQRPHLSALKSDLQQRQVIILLLREKYLVLIWSLTVSMVPLLTGYRFGTVSTH